MAAIPPSYFESIDSPLPLPLYSIHPADHEQSVALAPSPSESAQYLAASTHIILNLGPRLWKTNCPCYPRNSLIQGFVDVRKLDRVHKIDIKLTGIITNSLTDRGLIIAQTQKRLVAESVNLFPSLQPQHVCPSSVRFPFSIPIPSYIQGESDQLPPSFIAYHPRYSSQVKYSIKVDMYRKGLRLHESVKMEVYYLPTSYSPLPQLSDAPSISLRQPQLLDATVQLRLPMPKRYPAASSIPFTLQLTSLTSPVISQLLFRYLTVEFVRRITLFVEKNKSVRETILGRGEVWRIEDGGNGTRTLHGAVKGGKEGGDYSWRVPDMVDVRYVLRFVVRKAAQEALPLLPDFHHEEPIAITTHSSGRDVEDMPAIAMLSPGSFQQAVGSQTINVGQYIR